MSIWTQRAGRGGRNRHIHARAILLVQPSVFQELKPVKGIEPEDGEVKYQKDVEAGLREWIETDGCHRDTSAIYFNDGVPQKRRCCSCSMLLNSIPFLRANRNLL
jgi:superfamily II DNA helicase RecQ